MERHNAITYTARRIVSTGVRASYFVTTIKLSLFEFSVIVLPLLPLCVFCFYVLHSRNNSLFWWPYLVLYVPVMVYGLLKLFNPPVDSTNPSSFFLSLLRRKNGPAIPLGYRYNLLLVFTTIAYSLFVLKTHVPYRTVSGLVASSPCGKSSCTKDKLSADIFNPNGWFPFGDYDAYSDGESYVLCNFGKYCSWGSSNGAQPPIIGYELVPNSGMRRNLSAPVDQGGYATDRKEDYKNPAVGLINGFDMSRKAEEFALCHGVQQTGTQMTSQGFFAKSSSRRAFSSAVSTRRATTQATAVGKQVCSKCAKMTAEYASESDPIFSSDPHCQIPNSYPYFKCKGCPGPGGWFARGTRGESVDPEDLLMARNWSILIVFLPVSQLVALWVRGIRKINKSSV